MAGLAAASVYREMCERAARAGGAIVRGLHGKVTAREKGPADLVTEADLASERTIRDLLAAAEPSFAFVGEESGGHLPDTGGCWVVDPLDGTTNFAHGVPLFSVSVGLVYDGQPLAGAVYDPLRDTCFSASRGGGAYRNGDAVRVSTTARLADALVCVSMPTRCPPRSPFARHLLWSLGQTQTVRRLGSAALELSYVACGWADAAWSMTTKPWDVAAGWLLVQEAGGVVSSWPEAPPDLRKPVYVAANSPAVHQALCAILRESEEEQREERGARSEER